ncbi:MAG: hypothetical protein ACSHW9_01790 [Salinibacterium amurskyense]
MIEALRWLWAVQGTPCGRLLAAASPDLVPRLRRLGELKVDDCTAALLLKIAPATIDRRLVDSQLRVRSLQPWRHRVGKAAFVNAARGSSRRSFDLPGILRPARLSAPS